MDKVISKVSEHLAHESSRRGFMSALGKIVLGTAAFASGLAAGPGLGTAFATIGCCSGTDCLDFGYSSCPPNTYSGYTWHCCDTNNCGTKMRACHDCYNTSGGAYKCTFSTFTTTNCPCSPTT